MGCRFRCKSAADRVLLDIPCAVHELRFVHDLALIEAPHPHVALAFQAEGEASLDELHGLFERDIRGGCDQSVKVVRHDDERVQEILRLPAIVEDGLLEQLGSGRDLKKSAALRGHGGDKVCPRFLWCKPHIGSITEEPAAKAAPFEGLVSGA